MEVVKFVALLLVLVAVQLFGALGFSRDEEDGELWMVHNWKVNPKKSSIMTFLFGITSRYFLRFCDKCNGKVTKVVLRTHEQEV